MDLNTIVKRLNEFADKDLACDWDNVGLLVEPTEQIKIKKVFVTNDLTEPVLEEALKLNVNLIIAYHPAISKDEAFKRLTQDEWKQRVILRCIENHIAVYSPHTSWDSFDGGMNDWILKSFDVVKKEAINQIPSLSYPTKFDRTVKINLCLESKQEQFFKEIKENKNIKFVFHQNIYGTDYLNIQEYEFLCGSKGLVELIQIVQSMFQPTILETLRIYQLEKPNFKNVGLGRVAQLREPKPLREILDQLKTIVKMKTVRVALANGKTLDDPIQSLAVGAGSSLLVWNNATADLLITGELQHHELLKCIHRGESVVVTDHSNTERCFFENFKNEFTNLLAKNGENVEIIISSVDRDPLIYY